MAALTFDYRTIRLARGREVWPRIAKHVNGKGAEAVRAKGGVFVGLFQPQLGFASDEGVVVTGWGGDVAGEAVVEGLGEIVSSDVERLAPTLRPTELRSLLAPGWPRGGIYVHRWFAIDREAEEEFVALSAEAWETFEANFDAQIFGLFRAAPKPADDPDIARLLLLTRYASHGVWEASRNEAADPEAWRRFMRRQELTRMTIGRSSLLVAG